jgi:putative FmdB family regulatory protein
MIELRFLRMPLYEYSCHNCGETFEVMQKFSDAPLTVHEGCGGRVERLLSPPALQFKGSGWYVTDYGRNGTSKSSDGSESKSGAKSDSKPAAKTETSAPAGTGSKTPAEK